MNHEVSSVWTLRDVRRLAGRKNLLWKESDVPALEPVEGVFQIGIPDVPLRTETLVQNLDRAITRLGPDWSPSRPKNTADVKPATTRQSDEIHGGSSRSGETPPKTKPEKEGGSVCDDSPPTEERSAGVEKRSDAAGQTTGESPGDQGETSSASGGMRSAASPESGFSDDPDNPSFSGAAGGGSDDHSDFSRPFREFAEAASSELMPDTMSGADSDPAFQDTRSESALERFLLARAEESNKRDHRRWLRRKARDLRGPEWKVQVTLTRLEKATQQFHEDHPKLMSLVEGFRAEKVEEAPATPSLSPNPVFGGDHSDPLPKYQNPMARKIRARLKKLIDKEMAVFDESSPRLNPQKLVREITGKALRLSRIWRQDREIEIAILAVDVSGSCSSYCSELMAAARAVAEKDPRLLVLKHSNGVPMTWYGHVSGLPSSSTIRGNDWPDWWAVLAKINLGLVLVLGDHDAEPCYRVIAEKTKMIWFHNYCASYGPKLVSPFGTEGWAVKPTMVQGVGGPEGCLEALKLVSRP